MSNARVIRRSNARPSGKTASKRSSGGKKKWLIALVVLLLMAVAAWAYLPEGKDPNLANFEQLREQMDGATDLQRRELWGQMREELRNLPEESRRALFEERRQRWEAREQKFLNDFFAKTPAEQIALLDSQIDEEQERRERWAQRRAQQGGDGQRGNWGGRGRGGDGQRGNWGGRGRGGRNSIERRKNYLDRTSPQTRAQRSEYRRMRAERRKALGLPDRRRR